MSTKVCVKGIALSFPRQNLHSRGIQCTGPHKAKECPCWRGQCQWISRILPKISGHKYSQSLYCLKSFGIWVIPSKKSFTKKIISPLWKWFQGEPTNSKNDAVFCGFPQLQQLPSIFHLQGLDLLFQKVDLSLTQIPLQEFHLKPRAQRLEEFVGEHVTRSLGWWLNHPSDRVCASQNGFIFHQFFGVKILKIFELPPSNIRLFHPGKKKQSVYKRFFCNVVFTCSAFNSTH